MILCKKVKISKSAKARGDALWMVNGTGATYPAIRVGNIGQLSEGAGGEDALCKFIQ